MFSFIASHLVRSFAKYAAGSGISEIKCILAGFVMQGFLGFATFFIKSLTLVCFALYMFHGMFLLFNDFLQPLAIASGLSVGKEGPSVHVACCIGSLVAGLFEKFRRSQSLFSRFLALMYYPGSDLKILSQGKTREIVTAASAAGVAVAFGSPIGGVLFSIEACGFQFFFLYFDY